MIGETAGMWRHVKTVVLDKMRGRKNVYRPFLEAEFEKNTRETAGESSVRQQISKNKY